MRLVGFPHAGGGASCFHRWFRDLRQNLDVIGIQLPGRENRLREPAISDLSDLLGRIVENLAPALQNQTPFIFFGHSLGALLAFEVTRQFRANGWPLPRALIVSGRTAPHIPLSRAPMHTLSDDELLEEVVRLDGIPRQLQTSGEMRDLFLPILRADLKLDETYMYSPERPLPCPILACGGKDDPEAPVPGMHEWQFYTESRFVLKIIEGEHFYMQTNSALFTSELLAFVGSVVPVIG